MSQLGNRIQCLQDSNYTEHVQPLSVPQLEILVSGGGAMVTIRFGVAWDRKQDEGSLTR